MIVTLPSEDPDYTRTSVCYPTAGCQGQEIYSYVPVDQVSAGGKTGAYECMLGDALARKNTFDYVQPSAEYIVVENNSNNNNNNEFVTSTIDDPLVAAPFGSSGGSTTTEMPFDAWVSSACDNGMTL